MELLAPFYQTIYIFIVFVFTLNYTAKRVVLESKESLFASILLCLFMIFFIGTRPINPVFADMMGYASVYENMTGKAVFEWSTTGSVLFDFMSSLLASMKIPVQIYFTIIAALYLIPMLLTCRKLFPHATMLSFLVCLGAFSTFSYGVNGIRAGVAASFFLLALANKKKKWLLAFLMFVSWGFHHSMNMPIAAYIITLFFKNHKWYFIGWCGCLILSMAHISFFQELFSNITDEKGAGYLIEHDDGYYTGFRFDFVLYSAVPVYVGYLVKYKYRLMDYFYDNILNLYLVTNGAWLLCMYASFTNRIAYLSWFMYPILLVYPFISIREGNHPLSFWKNRVVWIHLLFTIFMMIYIAIR